MSAAIVPRLAAGLTARASRVIRFVRSEAFRRDPVRSTTRRLRWRLFWLLRPHGRFEVPFHGGLRIVLARSSASSGIYVNGGFSDPEVAALLLDEVEPGMTAIDCGAHIGEYTLLLSTLVGPEGTVHAFEPDRRMFAVLEENVRRNGLRNVRLNPAALGDSVGTEAYALMPDPTASSLARFVDEREDGVDDSSSSSVEVTTLDAYTAAAALERVDVVKVDVEGAEAAVLAGAASTLRELGPGLVFVECHSADARTAVEEQLRQAAFDISPEAPSERPHSHLIARRRSAPR